MVDGLLSKLGIGIVPLNRSSLFATSFPALLALGSFLSLLVSKGKAFLDKASVTNRRLRVDGQGRFPVSQANSKFQVACFGRGSTQLVDLTTAG